MHESTGHRKSLCIAWRLTRAPRSISKNLFRMRPSYQTNDEKWKLTDMQALLCACIVCTHVLFASMSVCSRRVFDAMTGPHINRLYHKLSSHNGISWNSHVMPIRTPRLLPFTIITNNSSKEVTNHVEWYLLNSQFRTSNRYESALKRCRCSIRELVNLLFSILKPFRSDK